MGAVYLGEHLKIGRKDAIKVLRPSMARDREAIARFTRGARNASAIRHPNVCSIYDFGTTDEGLHFLAMEFVEGGTLTDVLRAEGPLPPVRAADLLRQAAGALQVAHDRGIIHRDLKPDNMMLAREQNGHEVVKVVDFDIALGPPEGEGARVTRHGYVVGTPEYMSPEQLTGDSLDARSDVYSLALVFFKMLTGRLPFEDGTAQEVMVRRLTEEPLSLADAAPELSLPSTLEPVLRRALARRREDRPSSADEFAQQVQDALGDRAREGARATAPATSARQQRDPADHVPATEVGPAEPSRDVDHSPTRSRLRMAALGGGAGVLLVGLAAGLFFVIGPGDEAPSGSDPDDVAIETEEGPAEDEQPDEPTDPAADDPRSATDADPEPDDPPDRQDPSPSPDDEPTEPYSGPQSPEIQLPADAPRDILRRQLVAQSPDGDPPATLRAMRDTAMAVWSRGDLNRPDSALAAYLLGSVLIPLGDSLQGVDWLEEAVRLDPQSGYVDLLQLHRGGDR